jgi:hypothetical protein
MPGRPWLAIGHHADIWLFQVSQHVWNLSNHCLERRSTAIHKQRIFSHDGYTESLFKLNLNAFGLLPRQALVKNIMQRPTAFKRMLVPSRSAQMLAYSLATPPSVRDDALRNTEVLDPILADGPANV